MRNLIFFPLLLLLLHSLATGEEWNQYRGPTAMGVCLKEIQLQWNQESIVWKRKLPGTGQSSISQAGKKIFLTSGKEGGNIRYLFCLSLESGKLLWQAEINHQNNENIHRMNGWGTPTPATSDSRVVAFFGPAGMHCYDLEGNKKWSLDLGDFPGNWGVAASPIIVDGIIYQNCDSMGPSRLIAISLETGKILWNSPRIEKPRGGWSTPILVSVGNSRQLVLNGEYGVRGYDLSGKELWFCKGFNGRGSPVPFYYSGLIYVVNGKPGDLYAVDPTGKGEVSKTNLKWHSQRNGGRDLPSPIVLNGMVLVTSMSGVITCYDAQTGETLWIDRLQGAFSGSPMVSPTHYFIQNESGVTFVVHPDRKSLKIISQNSLSSNSNEVFRSTLSPVDQFLLTRSQNQIYCIR